MNYSTLRHHLSAMGYDDNEIEDELSNIADDLNHRSKDEQAEKYYATRNED